MTRAATPSFCPPHNVKQIWDIAARVIRESNRKTPADTVLRQTFKWLRVLSPEETREISDAVFTFFRWRGFFTTGDTRDQIQEAFDLAAQFQEDPFSFPDEALRAQAVPNWIAGEVDSSIEWLRTLQRPPNLWLRAKRGQGNALAEKLPGAEPRLLPDALIYAGI